MRTTKGPTLSDLLMDTVERRRSALQRGVITWGTSHFRNYPWRRRGTHPYRVLLAELLLKRTTATAASRTYEDFLEKYPSLIDLAEATRDELARDLAPVGLQTQRAKATARLARYLIDRENASVPASLSRLLKTPGLGNYSSRAILSFGHGIPTATVDSSIGRVLRRIFEKAIPSRPTQPLLQAIAEAVLPMSEHRAFNYAMLDLGAMVCRYARPRCHECPIRTICDLGTSNATQSGSWHPSLLRAVRVTRRISLADLARKSGMSKLTIINAEAGRTNPRRETLIRLADALALLSESKMEANADDVTGDPSARS